MEWSAVYELMRNSLIIIINVNLTALGEAYAMRCAVGYGVFSIIPIQTSHIISNKYRLWRINTKLHKTV